MTGTKCSLYTKVAIAVSLLLTVLSCNFPIELISSDSSEGVEEEASYMVYEKVEDSIDVEGGEVMGPEGIRLIIPEGALRDEVQVNVTSISPPSHQPPDVLQAGAAFEVTLPPGTELRFPIEILFPIPTQMESSELSFAAFRWEDGQWNLLGGVVEDGMLRVYVDRFSVFQVFGVSSYLAPVNFINLGNNLAIVRPWVWETLEKHVGLHFAYTSYPGSGFTYGSESYPWGNYYTWCVEWDEWTEPVWDLHGGGYWTEYTGTFHDLVDFTLTIDRQTFAQDEWPTVELFLDQAIPGICGEPPPGGRIFPTQSSVEAPGSLPAQLSIQVIDGLIGESPNPPQVTVAANPEFTASPEGVRVNYHAGSAPYSTWRLLVEAGQFVEATISFQVSSIGVQLTGDKWCGWARVLLDGTEIWSGDTYGAWPDGPGKNIYIKATGLGPGPHTIRVENPGIEGPNSEGDDVHVYHFGYDLP